MSKNHVHRSLKRPLVWMKRIRHRKGYGVQSPFAFEYITRVIYERGSYYLYSELKERQQSLAGQLGSQWASRESLKLKKLLFRMVNRAQPGRVLDVGLPSAASIYLQAPKKEMSYRFVQALDELTHEPETPVDFLYLHHCADVAYAERVIGCCLPSARDGNVMVIEGIHGNKEMTTLWEKLIENPKVTVSFDLYEAGILLFDSRLYKQDYIVNF